MHLRVVVLLLLLKLELEEVSVDGSVGQLCGLLVETLGGTSNSRAPQLLWLGLLLLLLLEQALLNKQLLCRGRDGLRTGKQQRRSGRREIVVRSRSGGEPRVRERRLGGSHHSGACCGRGCCRCCGRPCGHLQHRRHGASRCCCPSARARTPCLRCFCCSSGCGLRVTSATSIARGLSGAGFIPAVTSAFVVATGGSGASSQTSSTCSGSINVIIATVGCSSIVVVVVISVRSVSVVAIIRRRGCSTKNGGPQDRVTVFGSRGVNKGADLSPAHSLGGFGFGGNSSSGCRALSLSFSLFSRCLVICFFSPSFQRTHDFHVHKPLGRKLSLLFYLFMYFFLLLILCLSC